MEQNDGKSHDKLARKYFEDLDYQNAAKHYFHAGVEYQNQIKNCWKNLATCYLKLKDFEKAMIVLENLFELQPFDENIILDHYLCRILTTKTRFCIKNDLPHDHKLNIFLKDVLESFVTKNLDYFTEIVSNADKDYNLKLSTNQIENLFQIKLEIRKSLEQNSIE